MDKDIKAIGTTNWFRVYLPFKAKFYRLKFIPSLIDKSIKNYFINFTESINLSDSREKIIKYANLFDLIFTTDKYLLDRLDNTVFMPLGVSWINGSVVEGTNVLDKIKQGLGEKEFSVSYLMTNKRGNSNYNIRWEFWNNKDKIKTPTNFYDSNFSPVGYERKLPGDLISDKYVLYNSMYNISFENLNPDEENFSQRLIDCFLTKTIPVYKGYIGIEKYFNTKGMILFQTADELFEKVNKLTPEFYYENLDAIEDNYNRALPYAEHLGVRVENVIREKYNLPKKEGFNYE